MNKKIIKVTAVIAATLLLSSSAFYTGAEYDPNKVVSDTEMSTKIAKPMFAVEVNGEYITAAKTYVSEEHVMVPVRAICEKLGMEIGWDNGIVSVSKSPVYMTFSAVADGYTFAKTAPFLLGKAPELTDGITYVPVEFFSEILEADVTVEENGSVSINYGEEKIKGNAVVVSADKNTITVTDEKMGDVTLAVSDETPIYDADNNKIKASDLNADDKLFVVYGEAMTMSLPPVNNPIKINVRAEDRTLSGSITSIDEEGRLLFTASDENAALGELYLVIGENTTIVNADGSVASAEDLAEGSKITVTHSKAMTFSLPPQSVAELIIVK